MGVLPQKQTVVVSNILIDVSKFYIELLKAGVPLGSDFLYVFTRNNNFLFRTLLDTTIYHSPVIGIEDPTLTWLLFFHQLTTARSKFLYSW